MYVCTYQQIQDMLSLQCDSSVATHQEERDWAILYYKEDNNDVCTVNICVHVQLLTTIGREILDSLIFRILNLRLDLIFI